jgi:peptidyl-prolyl cis-trans isomerase C
MYRILVLIMIVLVAVPSYAEEEIVAKVNDTVFTMKDLNEEVDRLIPKMTFHKSVSEEKRKRYFDKALEELINRELQYRDALSRGMKVEKEKVDAWFDQRKKGFMSDEVFKAYLEREGLTEEGIKELIGKQMLVQELMSKIVVEPSQMGEEALKKHYEKNTSRFIQPESVKLRLISTLDEKKVQEIYDKLDSGEDFAVVATNMSEDSYRVKGGDIGYIHKGRVLPAIEEVAYALDIGELSKPFKADRVWYVIKIEDKKPERQIPFEEIKDKLKGELEAKKQQELKEKWIAELRSNAKIEILLKTE